MDVYADLGRTFLGGCSVNQGAHLAALGHEVLLVTRIAAEDATWIEPRLASLGLEHGPIAEEGGKTARCGIRIGQGGERSFPFFDPGVLRGFRLTSTEEEAVARCDAICLALSSGLEGAFGDALDLEARGLKAADFSEDYGGEEGLCRSSIHGALHALDLVFVGATHGDPTRIVEEFQESGKLFVITRGKAGSLAFQGNQTWRGNALDVEVADTTGAGDAFQAAFLSAHLAGAPVEEALRAGHERAAQVVQHVGALEGMEI